MTRGKLSESMVEGAAIEWFQGLGYSIAHGPDLAPNAIGSERATYVDVLLVDRLRNALCSPNPVAVPTISIAAEASRLVEPMINTILSSIHELQTLAETRDALLPKLLSGEVRFEAILEIFPC